MRIVSKEKTTLIPLSNSKQISNMLTQTVVNDSITQSALAFLPGAITTAAYLACSSITSIDIFRISEKIYDCTEEWVEDIFETVDKTWKCMRDALDDYGDCLGNCSGIWIVLCWGGCSADLLDDEAWCLAHGIEKILVQAGHYVRNCILTRGLVTDGSIASGDILLF